MLNALAIILHLVAINIWVGGMFFVIMVLSPVVKTKEPAEQHRFWQKTLPRFFTWVWVALLVLLASGITMGVYRFNGLGNAPLYVMLMAILGVCMVTVFLLIYFVFYRRFKQAMQHNQADTARQQLRIIRLLGIVNMILGFCVVVVIGSGSYLLY